MGNRNRVANGVHYVFKNGHQWGAYKKIWVSQQSAANKQKVEIKTVTHCPYYVGFKTEIQM